MRVCAHGAKHSCLVLPKAGCTQNGIVYTNALAPNIPYHGCAITDVAIDVIDLRWSTDDTSPSDLNFRRKCSSRGTA